MSIKISSILKDSLTFNLVGIVTKFAMALAMIYAAKVLGAEEYGIYGLILLWSQYTGLIKPGFVAQVSREIPVLREKNKDYKEIQNIAITGEVLFIFIPFIILICSSFLYENPKVKISLVLLSFVSVFVRINDIWGTINIVRKKFNKVAISRFIAGVLGPIIIFMFTKDYGIYILVLFTGISAFFSFLFYSIYSPIKFKMNFNTNKLRVLFRDGIILQLLAISFWAFRLSDRTMISFFLSLEELGIYTFAANLALFLKNFVGEFHTVLQPIAWGKISNKDKTNFESLLKTTYFISIVSFTLIAASQFIFYLVVNYYSTEYINSFPVYILLSLSTYFIAVGGIVGIILNSNTFKRYKLSLLYSIVGLIINLSLDYILILNGYGIVSIAYVTLIVQGFIRMLQFVHLKNNLFKNYFGLLSFYLKISIPFLILAILIYFLTENLIFYTLYNALFIVIITLILSLLTLLYFKKYFFEK